MFVKEKRDTSGTLFLDIHKLRSCDDVTTIPFRLHSMKNQDNFVFETIAELENRNDLQSSHS